MNRKVIKQTILCLVFIFSFILPVYSIPLDSIQEYTLENGLTVFMLKDTSTPLVRLEYTARAGFSNQTQETSGFFKLYTRIFQAVCPQIEFETAECNADSSRYEVLTVPSKLQSTCTTLAQTAFALSYSDDVLRSQLLQLKTEVAEEAQSAGGFINAAIDSRVFSASPWKHDSGVYPALFNKTTLAQARKLLTTIGERWYTPQNSALFISGNINEQTVKKLIEQTFGQYYSSYSTPVSKKSQAVNQKRKFVLHSSEFSQDMTQIVMQYTVLNMEESELAATMLNNDNSFFKYNLVNEPVLNIPGNEYINAASAHKKDSSRLIIQSLLQKPEGKNAASVTSLDQAQLFINNVLSGIEQSNFMEFYVAQQVCINNLSLINSSSTDFMSNLCAYWAMQPYDSFMEEVLDTASVTALNLFSRSNKIEQLEHELLISKLQSEEPFIFVIINSSDYKKNKAKYTAAGFEEINAQNAAWYNQSIFKNYQDAELTAEQDELDFQKQEADQNPDYYSADFYSQNLALIQKQSLGNKIPVITKANNNSSDITILLSIRGGKLNTADDNGFEEVMLSLLASNIQKEIVKKQQQAVILGSPVIDYECKIKTGTITIECAPYDFASCCQAISDAIIYGEILPSQADRAVSNCQYKKRLENGSVTRQMLFAVMEELYKKSDYVKIFDAKEEILTKTTYQKILQAYPQLLDASRYSIILTGLVPQNAQEILDQTMGILTPTNTKQNLLTVQSKLKANTKKTVKLTHTFLTDIPAEKAGPMPSKLVPTKEFLDPVMYVFKLPQAGTKENALTQATLKYLEKLVQQQIDSNTKLETAVAQANEAYTNADAAIFTIINVANQKEADACFSRAVSQLNELLNSAQAIQTIQEIKDTWTTQLMTQTLTNTGTAQLLQKGLENFSYEQNCELYLEEYNYIQTATRQDFISIMEDIPAQPLLRFYAK
ncbi:MAG: insulinase family protein [Treponema sp.]|nr:insulinase family protein [Treponema sp.]